MIIRPYQRESLENTFDAWSKGQSALNVLATGLGKTVIATRAIDMGLDQFGGKALFLCHREELVWQTKEKIEKYTDLRVGIEMADYKCRHSSLFGNFDVVVSTVQTQYSGRMDQFDPGEFSILVVDEAHHYVSPAYVRVIDYYRRNDQLRLMGLTATPNRHDELAMGRIFDTVAINYGMAEGIDHGWLVPIKQRLITVDEMDLSGIHTVAGDFNEGELNEVMQSRRVIEGTALPTLELLKGRKALVFASSVAHAENLCAYFNAKTPHCARWISGGTPKDERKQILADHAARRFQILLNVEVLTEGYNDPDLEVIVILKPTKSTPSYTQKVGRGTRPVEGLVDELNLQVERLAAIANSRKPSLEVFDFVGNSGKHKLVTCADVLGGNYPDEVVNEAKKEIEKFGGAKDIGEALKEAAEASRREKEEAKRREMTRRARIKAKVRHTSQFIDPFDVFQIQPRRQFGWEAGKSLTEKQQNLIEKHYGLDASGLEYAKGKQLVDELFKRWDNGQCSFKQAKILQRYNLPTDVSREQASSWIDKIAGNGWKRPKDLTAATSRPDIPDF